jgi:hypothetical protein
MIGGRVNRLAAVEGDGDEGDVDGCRVADRRANLDFAFDSGLY